MEKTIRGIKWKLEEMEGLNERGHELENYSRNDFERDEAGTEHIYYGHPTKAIIGWCAKPSAPRMQLEALKVRNWLKMIRLLARVAPWILEAGKGHGRGCYDRLLWAWLICSPVARIDLVKLAPKPP